MKNYLPAPFLSSLGTSNQHKSLCKVTNFKAVFSECDVGGSPAPASPESGWKC